MGGQKAKQGSWKKRGCGERKQLMNQCHWWRWYLTGDTEMPRVALEMGSHGARDTGHESKKPFPGSVDIMEEATVVPSRKTGKVVGLVMEPYHWEHRTFSVSSQCFTTEKSDCSSLTLLRQWSPLTHFEDGELDKKGQSLKRWQEQMASSAARCPWEWR